MNSSGVPRQSDSPGLPRNFKHDDIPAVKHGEDDQKDQEQEADEKHKRLDGHSWQHNRHTGHIQQ